MYLNGMGWRGIERVRGIEHTTVRHWVSEAGHESAEVPESEEISEITDLDELQTYVGNKRHKIWIWTAVKHWRSGILAWVVGDRSAARFKLLWCSVKCWQSFWYVSDGYSVEPVFIEDDSH